MAPPPIGPLTGPAELTTLKVGGETELTGGLQANGGILVAAGQALTLLGQTPLTVTNGRTTLGGGLSVKGASALDGDLAVDGEGEFTALSVAENAAIGGGLSVDGDFSVEGESALGSLAVSGSSNLSALEVAKDAAVNGALTVRGNAALNTLTTSGAATLESVAVTKDATIGGSATIGGTLKVTGAAELSEGTVITGATIIGARIEQSELLQTTLTDTSSTGGGEFTSLKVTPGDATLAGNLEVAGTTSLGEVAAGNTTITGTLSVSGSTTYSGALNVDGGLQRSVAGDMNIGTTETTNTVTIGRSGQTQALAGNATVSGSLRVGSGITVGAGQGLDVAAAGELKLGDAIATTISIGSGGAATLNLGTGSDAKTVNIATGTGGNSINLGTDDTLADTVAIGSPKDTVSLDGAALNVGASDNARTVNVGTGTAADEVNIGTRGGGDRVTIGSENATVNVGSGSADVSITDADWSISSSGAGTLASLNVSGATALAALTTSGAATLNNGLSVNSGGASITGGLTVTTGDLAVTAGQLTMGAAASQIVPGSTSFSIRSNADDADNLLVTDAGTATVRSGLTVSAGGAAIAGDSSITGALGVSGDLSVNTDRFLVNAATGDVTAAGDLTLNGGDLAVAGGTFNLANAATTLNLGSTAIARSINLGTGTAADTIEIGTGGGGDSVAIGANDADVSITGANWSISSAGAATFASISSSATTFGSGSAANPSIAFTSDADTGLYRPGADALGISLGGAQKLAFSSTLGVSTFAFQEPTTVSTASGALTLSPASGADLAITLGGAGALAVNADKFVVDASGNTTIAGTLDVSGAATLDSVSVTNDGTVGGNLTVTGNVLPGAAASDLGSSAARWRDLWLSGNATIGGNASIGGTLTLAATSNQLVMGTGSTITVDAPTPAASLVYTIPDVGAAAQFVMTAGAQTLAGKTLTSPAIGTALTLQQATADYTVDWADPGAARRLSIVDPGGDDTFVFASATQALTNKTLGAGTAITAGTISGISTLSTTGDATIGGELTVTSDVLPAATGTADLGASATRWQDLWLSGSATIGGSMSIEAATNQLVLGTTNTTTISAPAPAASRTYTIPDAGGAADFVLTAGVQTLSSKTLVSPELTTAPTAAGATWDDLGTVTTVAIEGGSIDGASIGQTTAAAASFTTLTSTGATTLGDGSASVAINSDTWDISAAGVASGLTGLTTAGTVDLTGATLAGGSPLVFDGPTAGSFTTTLQLADPSANRTITLPDASGTVVLDSATQTLTNKTLGAGTSITAGSISGATIDDSVIGGTTPAAGTFTNLVATGVTTDSLQVGGGATITWIEQGSASCDVTGSGSVSFDSNAPSTPKVVATSKADGVFVSVSNVAVSGFDIGCQDASGVSAASVDWIAMAP